MCPERVTLALLELALLVFSVLDTLDGGTPSSSDLLRVNEPPAEVPLERDVAAPSVYGMGVPNFSPTSSPSFNTCKSKMRRTRLKNLTVDSYIHGKPLN